MRIGALACRFDPEDDVRNVMKVYVSAIAALLAFSTASARDQVSDRARTLHQDALVFDAHVHVVNRQFYHGGDMGQRVDDGQFDLVRAKEGGLDAMFFSLFVTEQYYPRALETKQVLRLIDAAHDQLARNKDKIELAFNASDVERISRTGKIAAFMDLEGGFDLDGDLAVLRTLYRLGLRSFQLPAHNWANNFADSCCAPAKWHGLNDRGRAVVREANRLGMVINISHGSDETIAQAIDVSSDPLLATHHGLRSFNDIPRTMPDDLLRKLAAKGGVIGFQIGNEFHNVKVFNWRTAHAGKPFWDTTDIGRKEAGMTIEEIDKLVAPAVPDGRGRCPGGHQVHARTNGSPSSIARSSWSARITSCSDRISTAAPRCPGACATSATCRCSPRPC